MQGGLLSTSLPDGIESALGQASNAAGGKDVALGGGASTIRQHRAAGLLDEIEFHLVPILLGHGERLLDRLDASKIKFEPIRTGEGPDVAHLKYRVRKKT